MMNDNNMNTNPGMPSEPNMGMNVNPGMPSEPQKNGNKPET